MLREDQVIHFTHANLASSFSKFKEFANVPLLLKATLEDDISRIENSFAKEFRSKRCIKQHGLNFNIFQHFSKVKTAIPC
ncbi:hypothetical protein APT63_14990 [Pseudomonas sp. 22-AL-CL-001]|nr:hypothetical protein APT63_14990 [Pseudomonas monteilii]